MMYMETVVDVIAKDVCVIVLVFYIVDVIVLVLYIDDDVVLVTCGLS